MKKNSNQLCDSCKRQSACQDYVDNMKMREDGLQIDIVECDMHVPEKAGFISISGLSKNPVTDSV